MPRIHRVTKHGRRLRRRKSAKRELKKGGSGFMAKMVGGTLTVNGTTIATTGITNGNYIELEERGNVGKVTFNFTDNDNVTLEFDAVTPTTPTTPTTFYDEFINTVFGIYDPAPSVSTSDAGNKSITLESTKITSNITVITSPVAGLTLSSSVAGTDLINKLYTVLVTAYSSSIPAHASASASASVPSKTMTRAEFTSAVTALGLKQTGDDITASFKFNVPTGTGNVDLNAITATLNPLSP